MKKAGLLLVAYGVVVVLNALAYWSWSGDAGELPRAGVRLVTVALVAGGLWQGAKWAWWVAVIGSGLFALGGVAGLILGLAGGLFAARPHLWLDIGLLGAMIGMLGAAFFTLVSPSGRPAA